MPGNDKSDDALEARNRRELAAIADKIERGEALTDREKTFAASALRAVVFDEPVFLRDGRGRPDRLPASLYHDYLELQRAGLSKNKAKEYLAEYHRCSKQAVEANLKKYTCFLKPATEVYIRQGWIPKKQ
jgi:hypothetical protein